MMTRVVALASLVILVGYASAQELDREIPIFTPAPVVHDTFQVGWAWIDGNGTMQGRVGTLSEHGDLSPVSGATVQVTGIAGFSEQSVADEDGNFELGGLQPGIYFLEASAPTAYAAFAFQALASDVARPAEVYAARVAPDQARERLRELWTPNPSSMAPVLGHINPAQIPQHQSPSYLSVDGSIHGQLAFPFGGTDYRTCIVRAYQDGKLVASAPVDALARFTLPVATGGVTNIIVGGAGMSSCFSVYVEQPSQISQANASSSKGRLVSTAVNQQGQTLMVPVRPAPVQSENQEEQREEVLPPAPGPGVAGAPVGGGGGGAGGGGMGGAGAALGAAGLAVGIAALSDDDGFNVNLASGIAP